MRSTRRLVGVVREMSLASDDGDRTAVKYRVPSAWFLLFINDACHLTILFLSLLPSSDRHRHHLEVTRVMSVVGDSRD